MNPRFPLISLADAVVFSAALAGLYFTRLYSYLLFHSLAEMISVIISGTIFVLAWNSRKIVRHPFFGILGISYLFVGLLDLLHTLAYSGMGVFPQFGANLPTQLWIAARYLNSLSFLLACAFVNRKFNYPWFLFGYAVIVSLFLTALSLQPLPRLLSRRLRAHPVQKGQRVCHFRPIPGRDPRAFRANFTK